MQHMLPGKTTVHCSKDNHNDIVSYPVRFLMMHTLIQKGKEGEGGYNL